MPKSVRSVRVHDGVNGSDKSVHSGVYAFADPRKHARIPPEVYGDPKLTDRDVRVFAVLAQFQFGTPDSTVGIRRIARLINAPYQKISASIKRLIESGHISKSDVANGKRQEYRLLSPIFAAKAAAFAPTRPTPDIRHACARCGQHPKWLTKACYCWRCSRKVEVERKRMVIEAKSA